jgi:predicted DNA repair protein MutK
MRNPRMAGFTLLTLLDDIASILDDVALMTKTAATKTVGIVGDDLALTTEQLTGFKASREIPVVVSVAKGSMVNKLILIPAALMISSLFPKLLSPLLMIGGSWLCLEGAEKVYEKIHHLIKRKSEKSQEVETPETIAERLAALNLSEAELEAKEKQKIQGAVRTDFVLSAEIITIALGSIPEHISFVSRTGALVLVGIIMTFGVYGFVAGIVKLDDLGFYLLKKPDRGKFRDRVGHFLVKAAAPIMRILGIVGTIAMFLVGGGILAHNLNLFHFQMKALEYPMNIVVGVVAGFIILMLLSLAHLIVEFIKGKLQRKVETDGK